MTYTVIHHDQEVSDDISTSNDTTHTTIVRCDYAILLFTHIAILWVWHVL